MSGKKLFLIATSSAVILSGVASLRYGYENTWRLWNVPVMAPCFLDLRTITGGADSYALGHDPLVQNPGDPLGRKLTYPRIWQWLYVAGINQNHTIGFGVVSCIAFLLGVCLFVPGNVNKTTAVLLMLAFLSPAVLFGVERGNTDLLMFFLLALGILAMDRSSYLGATILILVAFVLKLYPVFAVIALIKERVATCRRLAVVTCLVVCYLIVTFNDLILIAQNVPAPDSLAYGLNVLWMRVSRHDVVMGRVAQILSYIVVLIGVLWAWSGLGDTRPGFYQEADKNEFAVNAFRVGSGIYAGTFLLGNNYDYRLMFLLFTIPQLVFLVHNSHGHVHRVSVATICAAYVSMWYLMINRMINYLPSGDVISFVLDELANWIVWLGLICLLAYLAPGRVKQKALALRHRARWGKRFTTPVAE